MITVEHLTKKYGSKVAVNDLSFSVQPGRVTGFLGSNGSGKSTTMRCIVGLDSPTSGRATVGGIEYKNLRSPITKVGALLDGKAFHPGRSARAHLKIVAATHRIPQRRVEEVLEFTGISSVANKRFKSFSLGMGQRLGIATALLGDPEILLFDEPVNGLDPDGVRWVRSTMRELASQGRTVLVSSHLMSEMALTADDLVIIGKGSLIDAGPIAQFTQSAARSSVLIAGPDALAIGDALRGAGLVFEHLAPQDKHPMGSFEVKGASRSEIGHLLYTSGIEIHELSEQHSSLEDVFMELTADQVEYTANTGGAR